VAAAIAQLPHKLRSVFVMCYLENLTGAQAAAALGVADNTVWKWLHEARAQLRHALQEDLDGE